MEELKEVKEIQETIIPEEELEKVSEEEFLNALKTIAPGTNFRSALDGALKTGKGALIAVENERLAPLLDGGFEVNCKFTPQKLIELTKMDGAIVLSKDIKKIISANVLLTPSSSMKTSETGTRHKAAERTAKQTYGFVIAISERKHEINLFYKGIKYPVKQTDEILRKANFQLQFLEKQRELFEESIKKLTGLETRNYPSLHQAVISIQKGMLIMKTAVEMKRHIIELGNEGALLKTRLSELTSGIDKELNLIIKDYTKADLKKSRALLDELNYEDLIEENKISSALAYDSLIQSEFIKGWRMLSKTSLPEQELALILKEIGSLGKIIHSNTNIYSQIIGEEKAKKFKTEIERMKLNY